MKFLTISLSISSILFLLYQTHAFLEYATLFKLDKLFKVDKYKADFDRGLNYVQFVGRRELLWTTYWEYLHFHYERYFLINLISCPFCFGAWLSLVGSSFMNVFYTFFIYFLSILGYLVLTVFSRKIH